MSTSKRQLPMSLSSGSWLLISNETGAIYCKSIVNQDSYTWNTLENHALNKKANVIAAEAQSGKDL